MDRQTNEIVGRFAYDFPPFFEDASWLAVGAFTPIAGFNTVYYQASRLSNHAIIRTEALHTTLVYRMVLFIGSRRSYAGTYKTMPYKLNCTKTNSVVHTK